MFDDIIQLRANMPELGKYTISSDFAIVMMQEVIEKKPRIIIEAGSGISTVLLAYCLEKIGGGQIISFDHLEEYANQTRSMLNEHKLDTIDVAVLHTPMCAYQFGQEHYRWYDIADQAIPDNNIDMLIVDGPPRPTCKLARYPILPIFYDQLSSNATVLLDDANRHDEKIIVEKWSREFPLLEVKRFETEKGAVRFLKHVK